MFSAALFRINLLLRLQLVDMPLPGNIRNILKVCGILWIQLSGSSIEMFPVEIPTLPAYDSKLSCP